MEKIKLHEIKLDLNFADDVLSGRKTFEVRTCDRAYQRNDLIRFNVINHKKKSVDHELNEIIHKITYVMSGFGIKDGWVVFGIKPKLDRIEQGRAE